MPYKEGGFLALDVFEIEALYSVISEMIHNQEKQQKKTVEEMNSKIESLNEARNTGFDFQKPNFFG